MKNRRLILDVEIRELTPLRVLYEYCRLGADSGDFDKTIRRKFKELRERTTEFGLDPDTLLHVGIPYIEDDRAIGYDCCIEFPLPIDEPTKDLPVGCYAVLTVEKTPAKIQAALRSFRGDYLPDHGLVPDEDRPTYEIYFKETLEYCVPVMI